MTTLLPKMHTSVHTDLTRATSAGRQKPQVGRGILQTLGLLTLALGWSACMAAPADIQAAEADDAGTELDEKLTQGVQTSVLWQTKIVTYCFPQPSLAEMPSSVRSSVKSDTALREKWRTRIQEFVWAINRTWNAEGVLDLRWQESCSTGMVRVSYSTDTPTGGNAGLGRTNALRSGVRMDADFLGSRYDYGQHNYHTYTAAHEMGHILGFQHEQDRRDSTCKDSQDFNGGAGITLGAYDHNSVMNYCNSQRTELTSLDRAGFKKAYAFLGGGGDGTSCHTVPANDSNYCTSSCQCNDGEGDCDSDAQCKSGLVCKELGSVDRCGKPTDGGGSCVDNNASCASWARSGECTKNPGYMLTNCCASCNAGGTSCHTVPANDSNYCTSSCRCNAGQGDCDSDSQCAAGLVCEERGTVDVCVKPSGGLTCNKSVVNRGNGGTGYGECEGDCDRDSDCVSGMRCMQLNTGDSVPGCIGRSSNNSDYCVQPMCI